MLYSPLETFEIVVYRPISFFSLDLSITNGSLYLWLVVGGLAVWWGGVSGRLLLVPSGWQLVPEQVYRFVLTMLTEQAGGVALPFFPLFLLLFLLVAAANLLGLLPFAFTVTAQFAWTFALALSCNLGFVLLGFSLHGWRFLRLFLPAGAPALLLPLIVLIEVVSYLIRTFSLSIRLFANMMAGHTLLHILATFSLQLWQLGGLVGWLAGLLPFLLILAVFLLELGIAFIQAYVFTILLTIYLNDSYHPVH